MMLNSPAIKELINGWQKELRKKTASRVLLVAIVPDECNIPFEELVKIICKVTNVSFDSIKNGSRKTNKVLTRHLISYYARKNYGYAYSLIGELLGGQDHTTVINGARRIQELISTSDKIVCNAVVKINLAIEKEKIIADLQ